MSTYDSPRDRSGSTFYSSPSPQVDAEILDAAPESPKGPVTPPPYDMNMGGGAESFAPLPQTDDPSFQPDLQDVPQASGISPLWILAGGALLVLWMRDQKW